MFFLTKSHVSTWLGCGNLLRGGTRVVVKGGAVCISAWMRWMTSKLHSCDHTIMPCEILEHEYPNPNTNTQTWIPTPEHWTSIPKWEYLRMNTQTPTWIPRTQIPKHEHVYPNQNTHTWTLNLLWLYHGGWYLFQCGDISQGIVGSISELSCWWWYHHHPALLMRDYDLTYTRGDSINEYTYSSVLVWCYEVGVGSE